MTDAEKKQIEEMFERAAKAGFVIRDMFLWGIQQLVRARTDGVKFTNADFLFIAETLLAGLDPDALVVEIESDCDSCNLKPWDCGFSERFRDPSKPGMEEWCYKPGPRCPGPAPDGYEYIIVKRKKLEGI